MLNHLSARTAVRAPLFLLLAAAGASHAHTDDAPNRADDHAPIGVMGDHVHKAGEVMLSYRYGVMDMSGNRIGTDSVSPETIATTVPNRFFGRMGQPPTLRVVPIEMTMQMHMVGAMYAPTDWVTLMAMTSYIDKKMDHVTFQGGMGTTRLGTFTTQAKGLGDTRVSALFPLIRDAERRMHAGLGVSLPTGSVDETDQVLAPNGMRPTLRLPYPMQLGSGTYDLLPSLTYAGHLGRYSYGAQYAGTLRLGRNDEDYSQGNKHEFIGWTAWSLSNAVSVSARGVYEYEAQVDGIDPNIVAPVQTANPDFQGGERFALLAGLNWKLMGTGHRLAIELGDTVWQDLNGPQLERGSMLRVGYQYTWN